MKSFLGNDMQTLKQRRIIIEYNQQESLWGVFIAAACVVAFPIVLLFIGSIF